MTWHILNWIAGSLLGLAWLSRVVDAALGMRHVADISRPEWDLPPAAAGSEPRVSIVVPARNEEEHIRETLTRLLTLEYSNYEVIAVNDRSTDRTGAIMEEVASKIPTLRKERGRMGHPARLIGSSDHRIIGSFETHPTPLRVIHIAQLPAGWLGKTHAMWTAASQATGDWLLFTDADVLFKPDVLRRAIGYAESEKAGHVVLFPRMIMKTPGERMMIAFFQALFVFGHRPWKTADPEASDHMGVGAFNMVRKSVYEAVGTYQALRMEVLDDMKLGKVVKNAGFAQRNVFGEDLISIRWAKGALGVVNNLTKNFFAVLSFQVWRTLASIAGLALLNLGPFLGIWLAHGWARIPHAVALGSIYLIYWGMASRSAVPAYYFLLHPISTSLFIYILVRSMIHTFRNDGIVWRGTRYPLEELRKGLV